MNTQIEIIAQLIIDWLTTAGVPILLILLGALIIHAVAGSVIERVVRRLITEANHADKIAEERRENTIIQILHGAVKVIVWIIALIMILGELGVEVGPLLAGLGVIGVAVGFGAQYLVRDIITGLFIIIENQYRVGDNIAVNGVAGIVEHVTLRTTAIRDVEGTLHTIPNGDISMTSNRSADFAKIFMRLHIDYTTPVETVEQIINGIGKDLDTDEQWGTWVLDAPFFKRVNDFGPDSYEIIVQAQTAPQKQWAVAGELRRRIKNAFDDNDIKFMYPKMVMGK